METFEHPLIRPGSIERRSYQVELAERCSKENLLIVLPTGLGKTVVALLAIANHLLLHPEKKCLVLAPTRVLVHQHFAFLHRHLTLPESDIEFVTGEDKAELRQSKWLKRVICATPQAAQRDLAAGLVASDRFALVIFDEAHRAVGNYAYCAISSWLASTSPEARVLAMTASLPNEEDRVRQIMRSLRIARVEAHDERSEHVKPYIQKTEVEWVELELPPMMRTIRGALKEALVFRLKRLKDAQVLRPNPWGTVALRTLLAARSQVAQTRSFELSITLTAAIRLTHAVTLLETQGIASLVRFLDRLFARGRGRGIRSLVEDGRVKAAYEAAQQALRSGAEHPKLQALEKILKTLKEGEKAIVFASYRDSVHTIAERLVAAGFKAGVLIGKAGDMGLSQTKQVQTVEELRQGALNVLVATQVGEEGLDIAECNLVVFYDNVPSAIRFVQRRGRTGRRAPGRIVVLFTKDTRDEAYYWASRRKVREAAKVLVKVDSRERKGPLDRYTEGRPEAPSGFAHVQSS